MAAIGNTQPTLVDVAKRLDPKGGIAAITEMLSKLNPILQEMTWKEGNLPTGHRYTSRTALPSLGWRKFNQGITTSKSETEQYDETCGMLEGLSKVDCALAKLNGNEAAFRASEDKGFVEALSQELATGLFYHSVKTTPEKFQGLTARFDVTSGNPASAQIIKADSGASGADQTSIWLVGWKDDSVFGVFPKGSKAGMEQEDLGKQLVKDANSKDYVAYVTHWMWNAGLVVQDYRYVARICNIDTSAWRASLSAGADLALSMQDAIAAIYSLESCNPAFYMNRSAFAMLTKQMTKGGGTTNFLEYVTNGANKRVPNFLGVPIRVVDAITSTESVVS